MSYFLLTYSLLFLPFIMVIYQLFPRKHRSKLLLFMSYLFFYRLSGVLIIYLMFATLVTYVNGYVMSVIPEKTGLKGKELVKRKRIVLALGIIINMMMLVSLKYLRVFGIGTSWLAPIGISYYTLQTISFMTDVYRGTVKFDGKIIKLALYLSFFPQIMEGPISRYNEVADDLYSGNPINYENLTSGYQRMLWGLFKKMLIADRLTLLVSRIFTRYDRLDGAAILIGAICFTIQLYMEFSGGMDIILGSGEVFGIKLPENFRRPFFAKNASEFWRRWHITLGSWLKDYIFYPISLAKPLRKVTKKCKKLFGSNVSKFVAPSVALFFVWLGNGIWHGPRLNYLFYGMYYFVIIFLENILEAPSKKLTNKLKISRESKGFIIFQRLKLIVIVVNGEMFFRANSLKAGFVMFTRIFTDFDLRCLVETNFGIDVYDGILVFVFCIFVLVVEIFLEKGVDIRKKIAAKNIPVRWCVWYGLIIMIIIFGAYGKGYSIAEMMYAAY